jgi:pimeloyl-ACP methyl ester carboxylesterase
MTRLLFLFLPFIFQQSANSQLVPYGDNSKAGKYITVSDAKLYYEVYGSGQPLLLLHGDTFGYISEFDQYIPLLAKQFKVIVPALRGHGKSDIGKKKFSYQLFAEDAAAILKQERANSV